MTQTYEIAVCDECGQHHHEGYAGVPCLSRTECEGTYELITVKPMNEDTTTPEISDAIHLLIRADLYVEDPDKNPERNLRLAKEKINEVLEDYD